MGTVCRAMTYCFGLPAKATSRFWSVKATYLPLLQNWIDWLLKIICLYAKSNLKMVTGSLCRSRHGGHELRRPRYGNHGRNRHGGSWFIRVVLNPTVTVADASMVAKARALHGQISRCCFIARSVNFLVAHAATMLVE